LLLAMMALDRTISFDGKIPPVASPSGSAPPPADQNPIRPSITNPSKGSIGAFIASILSAIFNPRRK
jgi:hypothetical protein